MWKELGVVEAGKRVSVTLLALGNMKCAANASWLGTRWILKVRVQGLLHVGVSIMNSFLPNVQSALLIRSSQFSAMYLFFGLRLQHKTIALQIILATRAQDHDVAKLHTNRSVDTESTTTVEQLSLCCCAKRRQKRQRHH